MANPFKAAMGGSASQQSGTHDLASMFSGYMQNFVGDPTKSVQEKLSSGEMSQQQYNILRGIAEQIVGGLSIPLKRL